MQPKCNDCKSSDGLAAPMLKDAAWQQLAGKHEWLCAECCFKRAIARRVDMRFSELLPCSFNLFHRPVSWFDLFYKAEELKPDLYEWGEALEGSARAGE
jgi:hypothetical protein